MKNRMPSLLALLGLAAAAGYQNRDKLKDFVDRTLGDNQQAATAPGTWAEHRTPDQAGLPRSPEGGIASTLRAGLSDLVQRFSQAGDDQTANSWVGTGQNEAVTPDQLRNVLGAPMVRELTEKTGLSEVNLLSRLSQVLPEIVDKMTPQGVISVPEPQLGRTG